MTEHYKGQKIRKFTDKDFSKKVLMDLSICGVTVIDYQIGSEIPQWISYKNNRSFTRITDLKGIANTKICQIRKQRARRWKRK